MLLSHKIIVTAIMFSFLSETVSQEYRGDACETVDGGKGVCKPIQECSVALKGLRRGIMPKHCGFEGRTPIVCCANDPTQTVIQKSKLTAIISTVAPGKGEKPEEHLNKVSGKPRRGKTQEPSRANIISLVFSGKDKKPEDPTQKSGEAGDTADVEGSTVPPKRKPGEAATYWCERFAEKCRSLFLRGVPQLMTPPPRRFKRELLDYEDFGTSEKPQSLIIEPPQIGSGMIGGQQSFVHEFPHMAAVGFGKQSEIRWECGGSLISEKFVLTAAHCLIAQDGNRARWVLLGAMYVSDKLRGYSANMDGVIYHVDRSIRHPDYKRRSKYNDLALLELGPSLEYDKTRLVVICPACLQVDWDPNLKEATATGWGRLGHGEAPSSSLQKVTLNIFDNSVCNVSYAVEIKLSKLKQGIDGSMICAGDLAGGKDTCQGDSGGPLQHNTNTSLYNIIGVTSFGKICGFAGSPAVYMRISHFLPWIESIVWPE